MTNASDDLTLEQALAETMGEVGYLQKDAKNDFHGYSFASAKAVLLRVNRALSKRGVAVGTKKALERYEVAQSPKGQTVHAVVRCTLKFQKRGQIIEAEGLGGGSDRGDKAVMKAETAALKYALQGCCLISWGDDPEADSETDRDAEPAAPKRAAVESRRRSPAVEALVARCQAHTTLRDLYADDGLRLAIRDQNQIDHDYVLGFWLANERGLGGSPHSRPDFSARDRGAATVQDTAR